MPTSNRPPVPPSSACRRPALRAVLFDLDGTLADTLTDICLSMNRTLERFGLPTHPPSAYRRFVGDGVRLLVQRALPPHRQDLLDTVLADYLPLLLAHGADHAVLYPGIADLLDALTGRRLPMAVLSNKPHPATLMCLEKLCRRWSFAAVQGQEDGLPRKPDPTAALAIAGRLAVDPADCLFLGDTSTDMLTAVNAGMFPVGCTWGFRDRAELLQAGARAVIDHPLELLSLLD